MDTEKQLRTAESRLAAAHAEVQRLKERAAFEKSFNQTGVVTVITRRCITTGRLEKIEGVFADDKEARRFAEGLPGYGIGNDIFLDLFAFFS